MTVCHSLTHSLTFTYCLLYPVFTIAYDEVSECKIEKWKIKKVVPGRVRSGNWTHTENQAHV
jgi:hypothetical protein